MSKAMRGKLTFGPSVILSDGVMRPFCTWCVFRIGCSCTHVTPARNIPDPSNTPEWCEMRDSMIRDAEAELRNNARGPRAKMEDIKCS